MSDQNHTKKKAIAAVECTEEGDRNKHFRSASCSQRYRPEKSEREKNANKVHSRVKHQKDNKQKNTLRTLRQARASREREEGRQHGPSCLSDCRLARFMIAAHSLHNWKQIFQLVSLLSHREKQQKLQE